MKGFYGRDGRFHSSAEAKAMFAKVQTKLLIDDPRESRISQKIERALDVPVVVSRVDYMRPDFLVHSGGGRVAHLHAHAESGRGAKMGREGLNYIENDGVFGVRFNNEFQE